MKDSLKLVRSKSFMKIYKVGFSISLNRLNRLLYFSPTICLLLSWTKCILMGLFLIFISPIT